jgi:hypothetical protein
MEFETSDDIIVSENVSSHEGAFNPEDTVIYSYLVDEDASRYETCQLKSTSKYIETETDYRHTRSVVYDNNDNILYIQVTDLDEDNKPIRTTHYNNPGKDDDWETLSDNNKVSVVDYR